MVALGVASFTGCYLSHERPGDGGAPAVDQAPPALGEVDEGFVDVLPRCDEPAVLRAEPARMLLEGGLGAQQLLELEDGWLVLAWVNLSGRYEAWLQRLARDGSPQGEPVILTDDVEASIDFPRLAFDGDGLILAWTEDHARIRLRRVEVDGSVGPIHEVALPPEVPRRGLIVWQVAPDDRGIHLLVNPGFGDPTFAILVDRDGTLLAGPAHTRRVPTEEGRYARGPSRWSPDGPVEWAEYRQPGPWQLWTGELSYDDGVTAPELVAEVEWGLQVGASLVPPRPVLIVRDPFDSTRFHERAPRGLGPELLELRHDEGDPGPMARFQDCGVGMLAERGELRPTNPLGTFLDVRLYDRDFALLAGPVQLDRNDPGTYIERAEIAWNGRSFGVLYTETRTTNRLLFFRRVRVGRRG